MKYLGNIVDIFANDIYSAVITVEDGLIVSIEKTLSKTDSFLLPGIIDSHIHIESSMLTPQHFARIALSHGTVATVSDPHEIANVLGIEGINFMIENATGTEMKFFFGAPSCVPATNFESSGSRITAEDIETLFESNNLLYLSEVMNYPGVIYEDKDVHSKLQVAKKYNRKIDGHAPGLSGSDLKKYIDAGIQTDHECSSLAEAIEKINLGMIVQIREGSAAKNFEELWPLIDQYPDKVFLCSDDLHPDDLIKGHINKLLRMGVAKGINIFNLLRTVTLNPNLHYGLGIGMLRVGDRADFVRVDDLHSFNVSETTINGRIVFNRLKGLMDVGPQVVINKFNTKTIIPESLIISPGLKKVKVIWVEDGELITKTSSATLQDVDNDLPSDIVQDVLKIIVLNRYKEEAPSVAYIQNFNLTKGAIASSIAHDSHNIVAVGVSNVALTECINWIIEHKGGVAVHDGENVFGIPLPIAGIISDQKAELVAQKYQQLNDMAYDIGCRLKAPLMTLSFMALLVIPELKISNMGLFDGRNFCFTDVYDN